MANRKALKKQSSSEAISTRIRSVTVLEVDVAMRLHLSYVALQLCAVELLTYVAC